MWDQTTELQPFKDKRLELKLENADLVTALKQLVDKATLADNTATCSAVRLESLWHAAFFSKAAAFNLVKRLPSLQCQKPCIQTVPLVQYCDQLQTLQAWQYDASWLPVLPSQQQQLHEEGERLATEAQPEFSKFWPMNFASAQRLLWAAGTSPGIYQIFLCRYEYLDDGTRRLQMRTEWYVGAASIGKLPMPVSSTPSLHAHCKLEHASHGIIIWHPMMLAEIHIMT